MRSRIRWLVAATTSAVVISFVVPLCLLVRTLAEDRAMAAADQEARNVAILVSTLEDPRQLSELIAATDSHGAAHTSLLLQNGQVLGSPAPGILQDPDVRRARLGTATSVTDASGGKIVLPVVVADGTEVVLARVPPDELHRGVGRAWASITGLGVALLLVALFVADRLGRRVSRPLVGVAQVADRLSAGDLEARAVGSGPSETEHLARALNTLADRITDLLAAERASVADLSHRLRTPVTALRLDAESVSDPVLADRLQDHLAALQQGIDMIVREARRPVRDDMGSVCDAGQVVRDRVAFWAPLAEDQGRPLGISVTDERLPVGMAAEDLRDVVDVLVDNVFAHTSDRVGFSVSLSRHDHQARLVVVDDGTGTGTGDGVVPSGRPGTTGVGLDIVRRSVTAGGGTLQVLRSTGTGTRVEIDLPLRQEDLTSG